MPDGYAEIIFSFGSVMRDGVALPSPFMMGLLNQPVVFAAAAAGYHRHPLLSVDGV
jgi:hypothetical protein